MDGGRTGGDPAEKLHDHLCHVLEVVDAHCQQSGKVEQDIEQVVRLLHPEEVLQQGQMARTGDGQELGYALDKAQDGRHQVCHDQGTSGCKKSYQHYIITRPG